MFHRVVVPVSIFVFFRIFLSCPPAAAHPLDMGLLTTQLQQDKVYVSLDLPLPAAGSILGEEPKDLTIEKISAKGSLFQLATFGDKPLDSSTGPCEWGDATVALKDARVRISGFAKCNGTPASWKMKMGFLHRAPGGFELMVKWKMGNTSRDTVLSAADDTLDVSEATSQHSWTEFIQMGVQHIGATPGEWGWPKSFHLPDGIDHILFVLALVLGGGGFLGVLKTVTGFTVGHSVTLALATLGIVHLPQRLVESAIALSIAFVAAEALFLKSARGRWRIALAFGLVHGLGFASALSELHLDRSSILKALIGFNIGVELGQAIIVALFLPLLTLLQKQPAGRRVAVPSMAILIFIAGSYWFVRRAAGI